MERRKILLGSGAAFTTALAGCFGSDTSDDGDDSDDSDTESITDGDENGDDEHDDDEYDDDEPHIDDIPGFDGKKLEPGTDAVKIEKIERKDDMISVVGSTDITDHEKLYDELKGLADDHDAAAVDLAAFADAIKTIEWTIEHDGKKVISFTVDVQWLVDFHENRLSREEFMKKVEESAE